MTQLSESSFINVAITSGMGSESKNRYTFGNDTQS